jgi:hypothetical protein
MTYDYMSRLEPRQREPISEKAGRDRSLPAKRSLFKSLTFDRRNHGNAVLCSDSKGDLVKIVLHTPYLRRKIKGK